MIDINRQTLDLFGAPDKPDLLVRVTPARQGRKKVTAIHKANIMKLGGRVVPRLRAPRSRATLTDIGYDERIVDAACMHLVMHPEQLDVLLLPNFYGDIVSDLCAGLVGGLGVVPGANLGERPPRSSRRCTAAHPILQAKNLANPTALLLSALMMLDHLDDRPEPTGFAAR